eukprot:TRINITY_DN12914_c0_g1_i1.p1 TRINITY_DN12914_c0_g1~~TRINITY_DN12914_c0_g1_i1.p1  ORF type:complete len:486 (-),score=93.50 TRINITY_DN12914_c0_g1_i1:153-1610(-)
MPKPETERIHDLSVRTGIFRSKLIEEFGLVDTAGEATGKDAPVHSVWELFNEKTGDPELLNKLLKETPMQLVKFNQVRRNFTSRDKEQDRRLLRVSATRHVPLAVWAHWVTTHSWFVNFIIFIIVLNAILLGISTDLDEAVYPEVIQAFTLIDQISLIIYFSEMVLKWIDSFWGYWESGWNVFDFTVTSVSVIPEIFGLVNGGSPSFIRLAKNLRVFRVLRSLKLLGQFENLRIIVSTILTAFSSMGFILLLVAVMIYIFAVFGISLFQSYTNSTRTDLFYHQRFSNLWQAIITLFQIMTFDHWYAITQDIAQVVNIGIVAVYVILWIWLAAFVFRNVFIGVMVKNFEQIAEKLTAEVKKERRELSRKVQRKKLDNMLEVQRNRMNPRKSLAQVGMPGPADGVGETENAPAIPALMSDAMDIDKWEATVKESFAKDQKDRDSDVLWPRDTLFNYLQLMEKLQENMKEYQELQLMAAWALMEMHDS